MAGYKIKITKKQFDQIRPQLEQELRKWWREQQKKINKDPENEKKDIWNTVPKIDSKIVVKSSKIFENNIGAKLHPKYIKPGGYESINNLIEELLSTLREQCN